MAVLVAKAKHRFEVVGLAAEVRVDRRARHRQIIGMQAAGPFAQVGADFVDSVAQHGLPARRKIDALGDHVPIPDAVVGATHGQVEALLAFRQRGANLLAIAGETGDLASHGDQVAALGAPIRL